MGNLFKFRSKTFVIYGRPIQIDMSQETNGYPWEVKIEIGKLGENIDRLKGIWYQPHRRSCVFSVSLPKFSVWTD